MEIRDETPICVHCGWIIGPTGCGCGVDLKAPAPKPRPAEVEA